MADEAKAITSAALNAARHCLPRDLKGAIKALMQAVICGAVCAATLGLALALSWSATAHDLDCHGMPISEAEKLGCCGAGDAHFGEAWQFYEDKDGFWHYLVAGEDFRLVRGVPNNMNKIEPLPSLDGCYTVWFRVWSDDKRVLVPGEIRHGMSAAEVRFYCLEIPMVF